MYEFLKSTVTRMIIFYLIMSATRSFFGQHKTDSSTNYTSDVSGRAPYQPSTNLYNPDQPFDFHFYLSPNEHVFRDFHNKEALIWSEIGMTLSLSRLLNMLTYSGLQYGDWSSGENGDGSRVKSLTFKTPQALLQNQSYYLHVFFVKTGQSHIPREKNYAGSEVDKPNHIFSTSF